jgi:hypothetical protein
MPSVPSRKLVARLAGGASRLAALLLSHIFPICSVVAPGQPGAARRDSHVESPTLDARERVRSRGELLTRHFLSRLFDNDLMSPEADAHRGASMALAGLLSAGAFVTILMGGKYITTVFPLPKWSAVQYTGDAFFYVVMSMILLALVAVVAWDGLALDTRDEAILGPLPIPRSVIVRAKLAAMGILAGAVLLALNGPPTILHPSAALAMLRVGVPDALRLMAAHLIVTSAAGLFGFCSVLALREIARALLGGWWPAVSTRLQALLILVLATAFLLIPGWLGGVVERLSPPAVSGWRVAANPPMWFVGLHEVLAGTVIVDIEGPPVPLRFRLEEDRAAQQLRQSRPGTPALALRALLAVGASLTLAVSAFLWNARRPAARARTPRRGGVPRRSVFAILIENTITRTPAVRAGFAFTLRTLSRSVPHRAALAVAAAFGLAMATISLGRAMRSPFSPHALLWTQTILLAGLLAGCEQAIRLPAHLPASWSLRLAWPADSRGYIDGVKRAIVVGVALPALVVLLLAQLSFLGPVRATGHFLVGLLVVLIALEARFAIAHPLPFLTSYVTGNRIKTAPIWFGAALFSSAVLSAIETISLATGRGTVILLAVLVLLWMGLAWLGRRSGAPREDDLDLFQPQLDEATQLKL